MPRVAAARNITWWQHSIRDSDLRPNLKLAALVLSTYMDTKTGVAWPAVATIAKGCSCSTSAARRQLRELERAEWITVKRKQGCLNSYRYDYPSDGVSF